MYIHEVCLNVYEHVCNMFVGLYPNLRIGLYARMYRIGLYVRMYRIGLYVRMYKHMFVCSYVQLTAC